MNTEHCWFDDLESDPNLIARARVEAPPDIEIPTDQIREAILFAVANGWRPEGADVSDVGRAERAERPTLPALPVCS